MPSYRITQFGGMRPRNSRIIQSPGAASLAKDVKLWHGTLAPWRYPAKIFETGEAQVCKLYKQECAYIVSDNPCASFTYGDTDCNRVFSTGVMPWPAYATIPEGSQCGYMPELEWFRLGVPKPVNPPTIISHTPPRAPLGEEFTNFDEQPHIELRNYAYSFVNSYGEEGALSEGSDPIITDVDGNANLGFVIPPQTDGYEIEFIRVYRGLPLKENDISDPKSPDAPSASGYFLVAEIPYQEGSFTYFDDLDPADIGEMYSQACASPPPETLENIKMTESGSLIASDGKTLWFSEPWNFHIWSCYMNFDYCIEAIGVVGNAIYLATNGKAYVLNDSTNDTECRCCRSVITINESTPISCRNSLVETPTGVVFATHTGLVRIDNGGMRYISLGFFGEDQWGQWLPHNLTGAYYKGNYFGFNGHKAFILDLSEGFYVDRNVGEESNFTELSLTPDAVFVTSQNELLMSFQGDIFQWDASDTYLPYTWRSALNVEGGQTNFGYAKVVFKDWMGKRPVPNPVTFILYVNDKEVFRRKVSDSGVFTLPRSYRDVNFEIAIEGIQEVQEVHLGTARRELSLISNT